MQHTHTQSRKIQSKKHGPKTKTSDWERITNKQAATTMQK